MTSRNNANTEFTSPNKFVELLDVSPHNYVGDAGKVYIVNEEENGLKPVTVSSIVPSVGTGMTGNIPTFSGTTPILQDSGVGAGSVGGETPFTYIDLTPDSPLNNILGYDSSHNVLILAANSSHTGVDSSIAITNASATTKNISIINNSPSGNNVIYSDTGSCSLIENVNSNTVYVNEDGPHINNYIMPVTANSVANQVAVTDAMNNLTFQDLPASTINTGAIYVNQTTGNDANTGYFTSPVQTIQQAIDICAGLPSGTIIIVTDGATYAENLTISFSHLSIDARFATLQPSSGDAITSTSGNDIQFYFNNILTAVSTDNFINCQSGGNIFIQAGHDFNGSISNWAANIFVSTLVGGVNGDNITNIFGGEVSGYLAQFNVANLIPGPGYINLVSLFDLTGNTTPSCNYNAFLKTIVKNPMLNSNLIYIDFDVLASNLNITEVVIFSTLGTGGTFKLRSLTFIKDTNMTVGNRNVNVTDNTTIYSTIATANLLTQTTSSWGSAILPYGTAKPNTSFTSNLVCKYTGGTTNYSAGLFTISACIERVA